MVAVLLLLVAGLVPAIGQPMTQEQSYDLMAQRLAAINKSLTVSSGVAANHADVRSEQAVFLGLDKAMEELRRLTILFSDNPWLRVKGFKVSLPVPRVDVDLEVVQQPVTGKAPP